MKTEKYATAWINSEQAEEVAAYYAEGHSVRETAEKFGVSLSQVMSKTKRERITNGRDFADAWKESNRDRSKAAETRFAERLLSLGFVYVGGYTSKESRVRIRCAKCGAEYERVARDIGKKYTPVCRECQKRQTIETIKRKRAEAAEKKKQRPKKQISPMEAYHIEREKKLDEVCVCKICGKEYTPRQYVHSAKLKTYSNPGVCSVECQKRNLNNAGRASRKKRGIRDGHRERARKYGCEYDPSVTLPRLIKRKGLRCAICGMMCNPYDETWTQFSGPYRPSIDHIVPMAKGGGHTWENVQVAHIICNSYKGDKKGEQ